MNEIPIRGMQEHNITGLAVCAQKQWDMILRAWQSASKQIRDIILCAWQSKG